MALPEAVERIRPSIVQVALMANGSRGFEAPIQLPLGTGFLVGEGGYVITAKHVVDAARAIAAEARASIEHLLVGFAMPNIESPVFLRGSFALSDSEVVAVDTRHDLALLLLHRNPFRGEISSGIQVGDESISMRFAVAALGEDRPRDGEAVSISGFPFGEPVLITNAGVVASAWQMNQSARVPGAEGFHSLDLADVYWIDGQANPGNSGGPVYRVEDASVIGVCVGTRLVPVDPEVSFEGQRISYSSGLTLVVPSRYVSELMETKGIAR